jgi:hypothetical protein
LAAGTERKLSLNSIKTHLKNLRNVTILMSCPALLGLITAPVLRGDGYGVLFSPSSESFHLLGKLYTTKYLPI